jgi:hypothetical protein
MVEFYLRKQTEILSIDETIAIVIQEIREKVRELVALYGG